METIFRADTLWRLAEGMQFALHPGPLLAIAFGVAAGIIVGAMPGLSPAMGVALLIPFTYTFPADIAIVLLVSVYLAADYGGSITAVTINTPGTPSAAVTAIDGFPLTQQGKAGFGLGVSLIASTVGGVFGTLVLILFAQPLSILALKCHPAEYFALAIFGLTSVVSFGRGHWAKGVVATILGLLIEAIGIDLISGARRFTFGISSLEYGISLVPALIGLFAVSEVFEQIEKQELTRQVKLAVTSRWPGVRDYWELKWSILRSSLVGTFVGIFPGAGATIASFVSYDVARRCSQHPEKFGHGSLEGVAAAEAANSSSVGGALVPLLTLGIPGSASTAVLIGALMIHKVDPGPRMMSDEPQLVFRLFSGLLVANVVLFLMGLAGSRVWIHVTSIPKNVLYPLILAVAVIGSYAVQSSLVDVVACMAFGGVGWAFRKNGYPVAPIVLGMVLGEIVEKRFRQAVLMSGYTVFIERPASAIILALALGSVLWPLCRGVIERRRQPQGELPS
jgi:putative tricarboxylic transport membrane protein